MKCYKLFFLFWGSCLLFPAVTLASGEAKVENTSKEIMDRIVEWSPQGEVIQVGDYTIARFESVWLDKGDGYLSLADKSTLQIGDLVNVYLVDRDENGFWLADRIIVSTEKSDDEAAETATEENKDDKKPSQYPSKPPYFEGGVWKN